MAQSSKETGSRGAGNFLVPLVVVAAFVIGALVLTFTLSEEEVPDQATINSEEEDLRPAGAGTMPEGQADELMEGITDELDEVDPASPEVDTVPPAEEGETTEGDMQGETDADETATGMRDELPGDGERTTQAEEEAQTTVSEEDVREVEEAPEEVPPGAPSEAESTTEEELDSPDAPQADPAEDQAAGESTDPLLRDDDAEQTEDGQPVDTSTGSDDARAPEGRDAQTELTPEEGQDITRDTDEGGTPFVATPSGPEGRDDNAFTTD